MANDSSPFGYLALGSQLLGGLLGAKGTYDQAQTQKDTLAVNSAIALRNAQIATQQAAVARQEGQLSVNTSQMRTGQMFSSQRASMAANGVDLGEGSPNDILTSTAFMGARDALVVQDNATRRAWAYDMQADNYTTNANLLDKAGNNINPLFSAGGTLLASAGSVASTWYKLNKQDPTSFPNPFGSN